LKKLKTPGLGIRQVMQQTREEVVQLAKSVNAEQRPAIYDEVVGGEIYLNGEDRVPQRGVAFLRPPSAPVWAGWIRPAWRPG
jgi:hypothetical protein